VVLTSLQREVGEVDLLGLVSVLSMVRSAYLAMKRGLRVGEVDLLGLVVSPEYGQRCLPRYEERPLCG
jgi:hypothetical protein